MTTGASSSKGGAPTTNTLFPFEAFKNADSKATVEKSTPADTGTKEQKTSAVANGAKNNSNNVLAADGQQETAKAANSDEQSQP